MGSYYYQWALRIRKSRFGTEVCEISDITSRQLVHQYKVNYYLEISYFATESNKEFTQVWKNGLGVTHEKWQMRLHETGVVAVVRCDVDFRKGTEVACDRLEQENSLLGQKSREVCATRSRRYIAVTDKTFTF